MHIKGEEVTEIMQLTPDEIDLVSGGAMTDVEVLSVGTGMVALGVGIVAGPVGAFGFGVATGLSFVGGLLVGRSGYRLGAGK